MRRRIYVFLTFFILMGCATTEQPKNFVEMYNSAIKNKQSVIIAKDMSFETLKKNVNMHLRERGYIRVVELIPEKGFMVVAKDMSIYGEEVSDAQNPYKIILKYTRIPDGKFRVDLVNGAMKSLARTKVEQDISILEILIKRD